MDPFALSLSPRSSDRGAFEQALDRQRDPISGVGRRSRRVRPVDPGLLLRQCAKRSRAAIRRVRTGRARADDRDDLGGHRSLRRLRLYPRGAAFPHLREYRGLAGCCELPRRDGARRRLRRNQRLSGRISQAARLSDHPRHPHHLPIDLRHCVPPCVDGDHLEHGRFRCLDVHRRGDAGRSAIFSRRHRGDCRRLAYRAVAHASRLAVDGGRRSAALRLQCRHQGAPHCVPGVCLVVGIERIGGLPVCCAHRQHRRRHRRRARESPPSPPRFSAATRSGAGAARSPRR